MRVCIERATGLLINAQSDDDGDLDVLVANAVCAGHIARDVEAKIVTDAEYETLFAAKVVTEPSPPDPTGGRFTSIEARLDALEAR